jgi:AraC-like DNA-binding protein/mannose-6-phosphate isomerase-like protein (cupin superfamily)
LNKYEGILEQDGLSDLSKKMEISGMGNIITYITIKFKEGAIMHTIKAIDHIKAEENISVYSYTACGTEMEHTHDFIELVYVLSGSGTHAVSGNHSNIERGDLFFLNIGQSHTFYSKEEIKLVNILLQPQFISNELLHSENALEILGLSLFEEFNGTVDRLFSHISFCGKEMLEMEGILEDMMKEHAGKEMGYRIALKGYMEVLLTKIFRRMKTMHSEGILQQINKISPEILKYIENNCFENITLKELARKSFYNPSYFSTVFKAVYGKTLTEFIHEKRIQEAVRLLQISEESVEEICIRIGYQDKKRFYLIFKEYTGSTPGEMRKKIQKTPTNL